MDISDINTAKMVSLNPIRIMKHQADEEKAEVNKLVIHIPCLIFQPNLDYPVPV